MMKSLWRIPGCVHGDYSGAEKDLTQSCTRKPGSTQPKKATRSARTLYRGGASKTHESGGVYAATFRPQS
jgi:hypothetical protein